MASYVSDYGMNWVGQRVVMDLREAMFAKLMSLPVSSLEDQTSGNIVANIAFNVSQVTQSATNVLTLLARDCPRHRRAHCLAAVDQLAANHDHRAGGPPDGLADSQP